MTPLVVIGGMAIARAVDDADLGHEIREAAKAMALSLGAGTTFRPRQPSSVTRVKN
jgi:hypothetical protein